MNRSNRKPDISQIGELALIERLRPLLPQRDDIIVGAGDDCAVVRPFPDSLEDWVLKSDPVIAERHFGTDSDPFLIGRKAAGRVLSDLAAMGAEPRWALVDIVLPPDTVLDMIDGIYAGLLAISAKYGLALVGGDTSQGSELALHVFACGALPRGTARLRSGAAAGHLLYVTGSLGGSLAGHHMTFDPRVREGIWLRERAAAMIDISDGLASELWHIAAESGVALEVDAESIPLSSSAMAAPVPLQAALQDGEDFELLFSLPPDRQEQVEKEWAATFPDLVCSRIGRVIGTAGGGAVELVWKSGKRKFLPRGGFEHFRDLHS